MDYFFGQDIAFQHLINFPPIDCVFCSVTFTSSDRVCLFLVFKDWDHVYMRNAGMRVWEKVEDIEFLRRIRKAFQKVIIERKVPCYSLDDFYDVVDLKQECFLN